jgi:hypothetical protein
LTHRKPSPEGSSSVPRRAYPPAMLRRLALPVAGVITVALGVLTVLLILGPGLVDPLLASDRIETVRAVVVGLLALGVACFVLVAALDRRATSRPPG